MPPKTPLSKDVYALQNNKPLLLTVLYEGLIEKNFLILNWYRTRSLDGVRNCCFFKNTIDWSIGNVGSWEYYELTDHRVEGSENIIHINFTEVSNDKFLKNLQDVVNLHSPLKI